MKRKRERTMNTHKKYKQHKNTRKQNKRSKI